MQIIWKTIPNFEKFSINQFGNIRNDITGKFMTLYLKVSKERKDYKRYRVTLRNKGKINNFYVHKLVAELHVPNPHNYKRIIFIDNNSLNIESSNLKWISDDEFKAIHKGNHNYLFYGNEPKEIIATHIKTNNSITFDSLASASRVLKTRSSYINRVIKGVQEHHKGYIFKYKNSV